MAMIGQVTNLSIEVDSEVGTDDLAFAIARAYQAHLHHLGRGDAKVVVSDGESNSRNIRAYGLENSYRPFQAYQLQGVISSVARTGQKFGFGEFALIEGLPRETSRLGSHETFVPFLTQYAGTPLESICSNEEILPETSPVN